MKKEFEKCNISFQRIDAVDAKDLRPTDYIINNKYDRDLLPGEIACYLSHIKTLRTFLQTDRNFALIIEDDGMLPVDLKNSIEETLAQYENLSKKHQWDVLKLNSRRRYIEIQKVEKTPYFIGACGTSIPITTIAAIWTRKGAEKFLAKCIQNQPIIKRPIDCELQHPWEYDLLIYNLLPSLISSFPMDSQIQFDPSKRKADLFRQINYELNRLFPKYNYYIQQHGFKKFYQSFVLRKTEKL
jgi:glycosyl transferase family 25